MRQINTKLIPVIHVINTEQAMRNIQLCVDNGIDMVFLISHGKMNYLRLIELADEVRYRFKHLWIGLNMLDLTTREALSLTIDTIDALWCDKLVDIDDVFYFRKYTGLFFGSLAFKYQPQPTDLISACELAKVTVDVATTSGPGTGKPASIQKIKTLRDGLGEHPLAIASGVDYDNVDGYIGLADYLMVASSITDNDENLIEEKLVKLKNKIQQANATS